MSVNLVNEFEEANLKKPAQDGQHSEEVWKAPSEGLYKLNVDATFPSDGKVGLGAILRDFAGDAVVATCCLVDGEKNVEVGEALAARLGLKMALEAGFGRIGLETDNIKLASHFKIDEVENSTFGKVIEDIRLLA
ncbi:FAM172 family protein-like protein Y75B8A.31 [Bienertia sinuspersici]